MKYKSTIVAASIHLESDNPIFGNSVVTVKVEDDAGGAYLVFHQCSDENEGQVTIDFEQFDEIVKVVEILKGINK